MPEGAIVIIGGTSGIGRALAEATSAAARVVIAGRDAARAEAVAAEVRRRARGSPSTSRSRPRSAARGRREDVEQLVVTAILRDNNTVRDYDLEGAMQLLTMKLVGYTEAIHALADRYAERRVDPALRRARQGPAVPGLDDRHDRQRRRLDA